MRDRLWAVRMRLGLTQKEFAARLGICEKTLKRAERDRANYPWHPARAAQVRAWFAALREAREVKGLVVRRRRRVP